MGEIADEAYLMAKLAPRLTGLPMVVWVTERNGFRHDVRVKVSRIHGRRGSWSDSASVTVRPPPPGLIGNLDAADLRLVSGWIELNRAVIIDYWEDNIDLDELLARLQRLP